MFTNPVNPADREEILVDDKPYGVMTGTATSISNSYIFNPRRQPSKEQVIFQGLLAEDELAIWIGREKDRKTTVALNLAICAALGMDFLGFRFVAPKPLRVVMLDYESKDESIHRRYTAICDAMGLTDDQRTRLFQNLHIIVLRKVIHDGQAIPKFNNTHGEQFWQRFVHEHPADLYFIDPMRCFHGADENTSAIETILAGIRRIFQRTVVIPHHMTKRSSNKKENVRLIEDMRLWSDRARGSGAIKAHADVILCQERVVEKDTEVVYLGAFLKDAPDVDPISLEESSPESFLWLPRQELSDELQSSLGLLKNSGIISWSNRAAIAKFLQEHDMSRPTAFRHVKNLIQRGRLSESAGGIVVTTATVAEPMKEEVVI